MQLRNLTIPYAQPAVFAPMAGFTDAACRHLMADHGAAWTVSEMASAKAITFGDDKSVRLLRDKAPHGIYAVQLFGAEPETMAQAIRIIQEKGVQFDILDINMGCPAPKITSSGAGSKLMQDPELCGRMVAAARGALGPDKPLTVKMRIGWDAEQLTGVAVARQCEANGADLIAVHGRTREQMYIPPIDVDAITEIRKAVGIPVLANGDITTAEGAKQILEQTGCAGVMIGRGAVADPFLARRIKGAVDAQPSGDDWRALVPHIIDYWEKMQQRTWAPNAPGRLKLLLSYFRRTWPEAIALYAAVRPLREPAEVTRVLAEERER